MTERPRDEKQVFFEALKKSTVEERDLFVENACAGDSELYRRIKLLLESHNESAGPLDAPPPGFAATEVRAISEQAGDIIGPYKLLQQIGEGGMGVVYMAEQAQPVERRVALKIIKPGMDTQQVIARFEAERQALAMMDHPNIAKVLDAGTTSTGRPFFVMELVKGLPITQYCDEQHLSPRERLELFVPICQAVQHAHQKGIIHRDLKPSNILIARYDDKPVPKVIDFGVAKATSQKLTEKTMFTQYGQLVGTIDYMSPEQAQFNQLDVDTRSDIYSLGVLLYELLTGETPFDQKRLRTAAYEEMLRIIREEEPPRPSVRLSSCETLASVAANRHMEPHKLGVLVRGELDWIVMKALEKDRSRRYETANGFAMDVGRYLSDEAVQACPPSASYRLRKFARRNKGTLVITGLIFLILFTLMGAIGWTVRDQAARQAKVSGQVEIIVAEVDQFQKEQKWAEALAAARRAEAVVNGGEADNATEERVRELLKDLAFIDRLEQIRMQRATHVEGQFDHAGVVGEYARAFREYGVDVEALTVQMSIDRLKSRPALAIPLAAALDEWIFVRRWYFSASEAAVWKRLVAVARGIDPEPLRDRLRSTWGRSDSETQDELRQLADSIDIRTQHPATLVSLARTLSGSPHSESAVRFLRDAQFVSPEDFWLNWELGYAMRLQKDHEGAVRFNTAAVSIRPRSSFARLSLGFALYDQRKLDEAIACFRRAIELDPKNSVAYINLSHALRDQNKLDEAIDAYRKVVEIHPKSAKSHTDLGILLRNQKKLDEAVACYRRAIELDPKCVPAYMGLGATLRDLRDPQYWDESIAWLRKGMALSPILPQSYIELGVTFDSQKKLDEAIAVYRQGLERLPNEVSLHLHLAKALWKQRRLEEAAASYRQALKLNTLANVYYHHYYLGRVLNEQKKPNEAVDAFRKAIDINPKFAAAHHDLGLTLAALGQDADAIACFRKAIEVDPKSVKAHYDLVNALQDKGLLEEAATAFREYERLALAPLREALRLKPDDAGARDKLASGLNDLAWARSTHAKPARRVPDRAVSLALEAVELNPQDGRICNTLGTALYRAKRWEEAIKTLERADQLSGGTYFGFNAFFIAMAHWQLGDKQAAQEWYDRAVSWMEKNAQDNEELQRFRKEGAELLELGKNRD